MEINEWKKLGAKTLDISLELCKNSLEKGVAYNEKSDFHSAIREFTFVIDLFPELVGLTKNLQLPPKMAHESAIMFANISCTAYSGRSLAYTQIGEKEKGNADMIMAEKAKKVKNALTSPPQNENQAMISETINSQPAQSTTSSDDGVFGDFKYSRIGSEIEIKKYVGTTTSVNIPSRINNLPVTTIGVEAFRECKSLTSIQIPNSVTSIGKGAFRDCESLTSIRIPNSVTSIGNAVFFGCKSLTSIQTPNSVKTIGVEAFRGCKSLTSIQIPNSVTTIGAGAFNECQSLRSIQIPDSVTTIGRFAFRNCFSLRSIQIPNSVTMTAEGTFVCCESLILIQIPNSVTMIGVGTFLGCKSLTSIQIPNSVTSIGSAAFSLCKSLTSIQIPNSITSIDQETFHSCESLISIQIPNSVTSIGGEAFSCCTSLTSIQIPNSVTSIGDMAFGGCKSLKSIQIPESTTLGRDVFKDCKSFLRISRVPIAEPLVETPKITASSYDNSEEKIKKEEAEGLANSMGCLIASGIFFGICWVIQSIWNFLFG